MVWEHDRSPGELGFVPEFAKHAEGPRFIDPLGKMKLEGSP
jgi:hypothetical protein